MVGDGYADRQLYVEAEAMEKAGFARVRVLAGGIRGWECAGGRLEKLRAVESGMVPAGAFLEIEGTGDWTILEVQSGEGIATPMPGAESAVPWGALPGRLSGMTGNVLLVAASEGAAREVMGTVPEKIRAAVFSVEGGRPAVERARRDAVLPAGAGEVRVQGVKQVGSVARGAVKKGCGSCQ